MFRFLGVPSTWYFAAFRSLGIGLSCILRPVVLMFWVFALCAGEESHAQCANFGTFNIGEDVEITCTDSCITLVSPSIASVAATGSEYEIQEIDYELPYPFNQGTVAIETGDDDFAAATNVPIGFTFNFYGNAFTECRISPNGWISFDLGENAPYNPPSAIPGGNMALNSVMAVYSDLNPSTCGDVRFDTYGVAPCREFVVSFNAVCQFSCTSNQVSAEIVLYEGTDAIEIYLGNRPSCGWGNAAIGIQNANGSQGLSPDGFNTGNWNATNEAWRFASSEVVEGTTIWYEGDSYLGIGDSLDFCSGQSTTVTGWFSQLPVGTFCTELDVSVSSAGSGFNNNQIDWPFCQRMERPCCLMGHLFQVPSVCKMGATSSRCLIQVEMAGATQT